MKYYLTTIHPLSSRFIWSLLVVVSLSFIPSLSQAQDCDLACIGTLEAPSQVVLNQDCEINVTTDMVVQDLASCPGPKLLIVRDSLSNFIAEGIDLASFSGALYINRRLSVEITDQATGTICVAFIRIADNTAPTISSCPAVTVNCLDNTHPDVIGYPLVADNCDPELNFDFIDNFTIRDCLTDTAGVILRDWTISDDFGMEVSCTQTINIIRASSMDVTFPQNMTLSCDNPDADPAITGIPQLNGTTLMHGDLCGLSVGMADDTILICNTYMYRIERTWTVIEECTDFFEEVMQVILISDDEGPVMTCPNSASLVFSSNPGDCGATIALPTILATDNCSSIISYSLTSSYGATDFSAVSGVLPGMYTVQYQAVDECGNMSTCMADITVVDDVAPVAVCDDQMIISIPSGGYALLAAISIDEGSSDNCASPVFFKTKREDAASCDLANGDDSTQEGYQEWYDDRAIFCCEDVENGSVTVTLRVYETDPGVGPVDPNRETGNGDLVGHYTDCQSIISLYDATGPTFLSCPPSFTIECNDEQEFLEIYGSPLVSDNCGFTLDSTFTTSLSDCDVGTIVRTWTATDAYGSSSQCTQNISVQNNQALTENDIDWPEDYIFYECGSSTDIEDLPTAYQEPSINWDGCGSLAINHTDQAFNIVPGACYKVLRTWTVIDWCRFNTENPNGNEGRFVYVQEIKVLDTTDPEITCPDPVTVNVGVDCATAVVTLNLPTAEDCSTQINFTNNSTYAYNGGANASGVYPVGTTTVQFYANDGCTNNTSCTTTVTVSDTEAPNVACIVGLTATLMPTPDGGTMASIIAGSFIASSDDNCTPNEFLKFTINRPNDGTTGLPSATEVFFDCFDAGTEAVVQVWVQDLEGNHNYCTTVVTVQDPGNNCLGLTGEGMIAGGVLTENGQDVESVMINISGTDSDMIYTGIDGGFMFDDLSLGDDYSVVAQNNDNPLNGVTTFDLILIGKHILGTSFLNSPYKIIAADIDKSGHISTLDIIKLRKMILNIENEFPNGNTSWRFLDASYVFPDATNPFLGYFPEIYNINDLDGSEMHADFIGIKVGDVNGSATANSFSGGGVQDRSNELPLVLEVPNKTVEAGETIDIVFQANYMNEWMGYQFTLEYDPNAIEIEEILSGDLPNVYQEENFHLFSKESGLMTVIWNEYGESGHSGKSTLFTLQCTAKISGEIKDLVYLSSRLTKAEAYTQEGVASQVMLEFVDAEALETPVSTFELFQNRPNPWSNETIIPFQLDPGGAASLSVYDMAGKLVYQVANNYSEGYHEINISREDLPVIGLFYYTLESGAQKATRKMVLMD